MKKICQNIILLYLVVCLSACPYIPIYKPITQAKSNDGLKITPSHFFYDSHKGLATCSVGLRFYNQQGSAQKIVFSKTHLINLNDTLKMEKIWSWGVSFDSDHEFNLPPKKDTVLGFYFKDLEKNFGDTIKVVLKISGVGENTFIYKKVK